MTILLVQTFLLMLAAFLLGASLACLIRRGLSGDQEAAAAISASGLAGAAAAPGAGVDRFGRALTGDQVPPVFLPGQPVVEVQPKPQPAPPPVERPVEKPVPNPDIALEQEKKRRLKEEKERREEEEREERAAQKLAQEKKEQAEARKKELAKAEAEKERRLEAERERKLEQQAAQKREAEEEKKRELAEAAEAKRKQAEAEKKRAQAKAEAEAAEQRRIEDLARMTAQATGSGGSGQAARSQGPSRGDAGYAAKVAGKIRSNTVFNVPDELANNPAVEYAVDLLPDGSVRGIRKVKGSGVPGFDEAVRRAIEKSQPFPPDNSGRAPSGFTVSHKPKDQ